ncbi:hypothetical protein B7494_g8356 [Chlorociboria aeruginascens]|nr:hypothetical protein B7494_g8356 [Chlorociboria aeruginascens]
MAPPVRTPENMSFKMPFAPQMTPTREPPNPPPHQSLCDQQLNEVERRLMGSQTGISIVASQLMMNVHELRNAQRLLQNIRGALKTPGKDGSLLDHITALVSRASLEDLKAIEIMVWEAKLRLQGGDEFLEGRDGLPEQVAQNTMGQVPGDEMLRYGAPKTVRKHTGSIADSSHSLSSLHQQNPQGDYEDEYVRTGPLDDPFVDFGPTSSAEKFEMKSPFKEHSFMEPSGPVPRFPAGSNNKGRHGLLDNISGHRKVGPASMQSPPDREADEK